MKTKEEYQAAVDEIREVCRKHGVFLLAYSEGQDAEIVVGDVTTDSDGWSMWIANDEPHNDLTCVRDDRYSTALIGDPIVEAK